MGPSGSLPFLGAGKPRSYIAPIKQLETPQMPDNQAEQPNHIRWVEATLRNLTSNLLRTCRGAGHPEAILDDAVAFFRACDRYREKEGHYPIVGDTMATLSAAVASPSQPTKRWREANAETAIILGALQIVASRLVGQSHMEDRGREQLRDGVKAYVEAMPKPLT